MTDWSRRDVLSAVAAGLAAGELPGAVSGAAAPDKNATQHPMRVRTITAGVALSGLDDMAAIEKALGRLSRVRQRVKSAEIGRAHV